MKPFALVLALLLAAPAGAHRGHDALTMVTVDAATITVSHRFDASDVELALSDIAPDAQPNLDDPAAIAALVAYLRARFTVASERGPVALAAGVPEIGAEEVRVDFTARLPAPPKRLTLGSRLLSDVYPRQVNQVNVRVGRSVRTLTFAGGDVQTIELITK